MKSDCSGGSSGSSTSAVATYTHKSGKKLFWEKILFGNFSCNATVFKNTPTRDLTIRSCWKISEYTCDLNSTDSLIISGSLVDFTVKLPNSSFYGCLWYEWISVRALNKNAMSHSQLRVQPKADFIAIGYLAKLISKTLNAKWLRLNMVR